MSQHLSNSTVTSFFGIDGDVQIAVGAASRTIVIDAQGCRLGTDGVLRHNHGTVRLTYEAAREMAEFIAHLDEPHDDRQPRLWSDSVAIEPLRHPVPARRQRRRVACVAGLVLALCVTAPAFADPCPVGVVCPVTTADNPPPRPDAELVAVLAHRQRTLDAIHAVAVQQLLVEQEALAALRQLQAAQASGGRKKP